MDLAHRSSLIAHRSSRITTRRPFERVAVRTDTRMQDMRDDDAIISRTVPTRQRFVLRWAGHSSSPRAT